MIIFKGGAKMDTKVEQFLQEQFHQFSQIDVRELVFSSELHKYCERNACGKYNTNWMCPPGIGDLKPLITKYISFAKGYLFNLVITLSDVFNYEEMEQGRKIMEAKLKTLQKQLKSVPHAIFGAGGCSLCPSCTYPLSTCRKPGEATPSLEAVGIDVYQLASKAGLKYYHGPSTVTYFAMVLL